MKMTDKNKAYRTLRALCVDQGLEPLKFVREHKKLQKELVRLKKERSELTNKCNEYAIYITGKDLEIEELKRSRVEHIRIERDVWLERVKELRRRLKDICVSEKVFEIFDEVVGK